jgi:hypothetical protein
VSQLFFGPNVFGHGMIGLSIFVGSFIAGALWLPLQVFFAVGFVALGIKRRTAVAS